MTRHRRGGIEPHGPPRSLAGIGCVESGNPQRERLGGEFVFDAPRRAPVAGTGHPVPLVEHFAEPGRAAVIEEERKLLPRHPELRENRFIESGVAHPRVIAEPVHRIGKERIRVDPAHVNRMIEREAGPVAGQLASDVVDVVAVGRLVFRVSPPDEFPPAELERQIEPPVPVRGVNIRFRPVLVRRGAFNHGDVDVEEPLEPPVRGIPRLKPRAVMPPRMDHRRIFHADRPVKLPGDFQHELSGIIPVVLIPPHPVQSVDRVEVKPVESASVHHIGVILRDFIPERRLEFRDIEPAPVRFEKRCGAPRLVRRGRRSVMSPFAP